MNNKDFKRLLNLLHKENIMLIDKSLIGNINLNSCEIDQEYLSDRLQEEEVLKWVEKTNSILKRLKKGDLPSSFTARMVSRKNWSGLDSHTIDHALDELEEAGYVKRVVEKGHGRPKEEFIVNPRWLKEG